MYKYHPKTDRNFFNIIKFTNKLNFPYSRIQIVIKSKDPPQKLSSKELLFRRFSLISFFSYLDWLDHFSSLKDLVKIVRNESDLAYKQIWKERSRPRLSWIYRKSDQPRSRSPLTYSKLNWASYRPLSGKLSYDLSATTTSKKPEKEAGTKVPASQLSLDCRARRSGWVGSTTLILSAFTVLLNCAEVGRRNRILTNYRFLSHSPILLL